MTAKELKRLSRRDMLELMIKQAEKIESLESQLAESNKKLAGNALAIDKAGSLAEAALMISGVLEAAERAGSIYLDNIKLLDGRQEEINSRRDSESRDEAEKIISQARSRSEEIIALAKDESRRRIKSVNTKISALLSQSDMISKALAVYNEELENETQTEDSAGCGDSETGARPDEEPGEISQRG